MERFKHLQVHYYWWSFIKHHQSQWLLQDTIYFLFHFAWICFACLSNYFFFKCIISGMFSMTCSLVAFSLIMNSMKKPSSYCLSPLAHRIINAWHNSGPDLQSAPTPWMLDASAPIGGSQLLLACLPAWVLVLAWFSCLCGGGLCLETFLLFMYMCNWPLAAQVPVHCELCVTLWSFYCLYRITTVLIVQYCLSPPWLKP